MKKDFSILKWLIFPLLILAFAAGIAYNSTKIFGAEGSVAYYLILLGIFVISLVMILHTSKHQNESGEKIILPSTKAAFGFECGLMLALGVTLVCSIYVARQMAGNKEAAASDVQMVQAVGKLKSAKAQANLSKNIKPTGDIAAAFASAESLMFWPLVAELGLALAGLMTVFGLVLFVNHRSSQASQGDSQESFRESPYSGSLPERQSASLRQSTRAAAFTVGSLPADSRTYPAVSNGQGASFLFKAQGAGYGLHFRERGGNSKHVTYLTAREAPKWAEMSFGELAKDAVKKRESRHGKDALCIAIETAAT